MPLANKILVTVFAILLIITIGEIGYYFYITSNKSRSQVTNTVANNESNKIVPSIISPTPSPYLHAFLSENLEFFKDLPRQKQKRLYIYQESHNIVVDIAPEGKNYKDKFFPYAFKYKYGCTSITECDGESWIYLPEISVQKIKVKIEVKSGKFEDGNLKDLQPGNHIIFKELFDPFYKPNDPKQLISSTIKVVKDAQEFDTFAQDFINE